MLFLRFSGPHPACLLFTFQGFLMLVAYTISRDFSFTQQEKERTAHPIHLPGSGSIEEGSSSVLRGCPPGRILLIALPCITHCVPLSPVSSIQGWSHLEALVRFRFDFLARVFRERSFARRHNDASLSFCAIFRLRWSLCRFINSLGIQMASTLSKDVNLNQRLENEILKYGILFFHRPD